MTTVRYVQDGVGVVVRDDVSAPLLEALRRAPQTMMGRMLTEVEAQASAARASAPVRTGAWRGSITTWLRMSDQEVRAGIGVGEGVPYGRYVRFGRSDPARRGKSAWQELLRRPAVAAAPQLARDVLGDLADSMPGRRS